jgi:hypothetical protein
MDHEVFRAICLKITEEKKPRKIELLEQRLCILLSEETPEGSPNKKQERVF